MVDELDSKKPNPKLIKLITIMSPIILSLLIASTVLAVTFLHDDLTKSYFDVNSINEDKHNELFFSLVKNVIF